MISLRVTPDRQRALDMGDQLRLGGAERSERGDGGDLTVAQREPRAGIDLAEPEFDDRACQIGGDVRQGVAPAGHPRRRGSGSATPIRAQSGRPSHVSCGRFPGSRTLRTGLRHQAPGGYAIGGSGLNLFARTWADQGGAAGSAQHAQTRNRYGSSLLAQPGITVTDPRYPACRTTRRRAGRSGRTDSRTSSPGRGNCGACGGATRRSRSSAGRRVSVTRSGCGERLRVELPAGGDHAAHLLGDQALGCVQRQLQVHHRDPVHRAQDRQRLGVLRPVPVVEGHDDRMRREWRRSASRPTPDPC